MVARFIRGSIHGSFHWRYVPRPQGRYHMSLSTIFNSIDQYVKLPAWLQFVGLMLAFGGLIFIDHPGAKLVAYVGLGISAAGFAYDKIYP
jgi:hypothetical protein